MPLETREIPSLIFWFFVSGVAIYATSKVLGKVNEKIHTVFLRR